MLSSRRPLWAFALSLSLVAAGCSCNTQPPVDMVDGGEGGGGGTDLDAGADGGIPDAGSTLTITTTSLLSGAVGVPYAAQLSATGGAPPVTWALRAGASLPPGLTLDLAGAISGTPTAPGSFTFAVGATDSSNATVSASLSISVAPAALAVTTSTLPVGTVGTAYSQALAASGGVLPYAWAVSRGTLPAGLSLNPSGVLSGTPTVAGNFSFAVAVTDAANPAQSATRSLALTVQSGIVPLVVTTTALPNATLGVTYSAALAAGGGTQPYTWSVTAGSLPPGITLSTSGLLSGTPTTAGASSFSVTVTDSVNPAQSTTASLGITVLANSSSLQVTTVSLPGGTAGSSYSASFSASGGAAPFSWSIASGALPPGLTLSTTGGLSGTPSQIGSFTFTVQVSDGSRPQQSSQKQFTIAIGTAPLTITTTALPNGTISQAYSATVTANGGATPYAFAVSAGTLPPGLSLDATTGVLAGTPTTAGGYTFTVTMTDASTPQKSASQAFSITISAASATLSITTTALADAVRTVAYSTSVTASGGTTPYRFSVQGGSLPPGLSLNGATGAISGTPTTTGGFSFTISVADSSTPQKLASKPLSINVRDPLIVTTTSLAGGVVGSAYTAAVAASGGLTPYTFSVSSGALPPGLTMSSTGAITGTPTATGVYGFAVQVVDSANPKQTTTANLSIAVTATLQLATTSLPAAIVGVGYTQTLTATGGASPYTWSVSAGALPAGLGLDATTGTISGTPAAAGTFSFTVQVTDASTPQQTATQALSITVSNPSSLTISTASLPGGVIGQVYSTALNAVGGTSPYAWSISSGSLPAGLSMASTTGIISGTPTAAGASSFTVQVVDGSTPQQTATKALSIVVTAPLAVATTTLPAGVTGSVYSANLSATGGATPYAWSISTGALPPGLSLNSTTGAITGTPTSAGSFGFTVSVVDASSPQQAASATMSITITAALTITTASLPNGTVSQPYSATIAAGGGTTPYAFSVSAGALPTGLTLNGTTGAISGTPSSAGSFTLTVMVTDASSPMQTASKNFTIIINPVGTLTITTTSLSGGVVGSAYNATVAASGGTTPYAWSVSVGSLPPGLTLNATTGAITGTPSTGGSYTFTIQVSDASSPLQTATRQFTISILAQLAITTTALPGAVVNQAYSASLSATGGTTLYTWSISAGSLPLGLSLDSATGVISGTPTLAGTSNFTVRVVDSSVPQQTATKALSIKVVTVLAVTTTSLPAGTVGAAYSAALAASGGTTPYSWGVTSGALPAGLALNSANGQISGTPATAGTFSFTVTATDSSNPAQTASKSLSIAINPPLTVTTTSLPSATVAVSYSGTLSASGGVAPYSWSIALGSLPPGLTLAAATGAITGTPSTAGTYSFTVQVADSSTVQQTATKALSILVNPAGSLTITTSSLSNGIKGTLYSATLAATGGTTPYNWTISAGSLPSGLTLNASTGVISGTPTTSGTFSFTATVTDSSSPQQTASRALSIRVSDALLITTTSLPGAITGTAYSATLTGSGGFTPYTWSISAGSLPGGLTLNASTGTISGTPTTAGTSSFTVRLVDASNPQQATTKALSITVTAMLTITTALLPNGALNVNYNTTVNVIGGTTPYTFSISAGALPPGLALNATTGAITGTPTASGTFTFTVLVVDSGSPQQSANKQFSIRIF